MPVLGQYYTLILYIYIKACMMQHDTHIRHTIHNYDDKLALIINFLRNTEKGISVFRLDIPN